MSSVHGNASAARTRPTRKSEDEGRLKRSGLVLAIGLIAAPAAAQEPSRVEGFAEGFTFNAMFSTSHTTDGQGSVVYRKSGADGARIAIVRQGADPCVFVSTPLDLNASAGAAPVVLLEETYDLRGVIFESNPEHQFAPPGGTSLTMKGPHGLCRISTGGSRAKLSYLHECRDEMKTTITASMLPAFERTAAVLNKQCRWKWRGSSPA